MNNLTKVWTKCPSVTREGKSFYVASYFRNGSLVRVTVLQSVISDRWRVNSEGRTLPTAWAKADEAKRYAESVFEFGRFFIGKPVLNELERRILQRIVSP